MKSQHFHKRHVAVARYFPRSLQDAVIVIIITDNFYLCRAENDAVLYRIFYPKQHHFNVAWNEQKKLSVQ